MRCGKYEIEDISQLFGDMWDDYKYWKDEKKEPQKSFIFGFLYPGEAVCDKACRDKILYWFNNRGIYASEKEDGGKAEKKEYTIKFELLSEFSGYLSGGHETSPAVAAKVADSDTRERAVPAVWGGASAEETFFDEKQLEALEDLLLELNEAQGGGNCFFPVKIDPESGSGLYIIGRDLLISMGKDSEQLEVIESVEEQQGVPIPHKVLLGDDMIPDYLVCIKKAVVPEDWRIEPGKEVVMEFEVDAELYQTVSDALQVFEYRRSKKEFLKAYRVNNWVSNDFLKTLGSNLPKSLYNYVLPYFDPESIEMIQKEEKRKTAAVERQISAKTAKRSEAGKAKEKAGIKNVSKRPLRNPASPKGPKPKRKVIVKKGSKDS